MKSDVIDLDVHLIAETPKAILINLGYDEDDKNKKEDVWLPKSQIEINNRQKSIINITLPEWLAVNKGLI